MLTIKLMIFWDIMSFEAQGPLFQKNLLPLKMEAAGLFDKLACNFQITKTAHCYSLRSQLSAMFIKEKHLYITV